MRSLRLFMILCFSFLLVHPVSAAQKQFKGYTFDAYVVKSNSKHYKEFQENNQLMLKVKPNEEYAIVVKNPLPVQVGVAVSVDGLNSIDGKRTSTRTAKKWIIGPNSSITVSGWQTSSKTLRKFVFTEQSASLAQWREDKDGKKFTKNLGVIGVAWFWNAQELELALHPPQPQPFVEEESNAPSMRDMAGAKKSAAAPSAARSESRAGTGMGAQQQHAVTEVEFNPTDGMFAVKDVLKIFYEFAQLPPEPLPFVEEDEDEGRFTPDMYK